MVRVALTPRSWLLKARLANGVVIYGQNRAGFGGRGVYIYRDEVEPEVRCLDRFLDPGSVLVDVGASTGVYTLKAAQLVGAAGVVLALEPFLEIAAMLRRSIQANGFANVRLHECAAGDRAGTGLLWTNLGRPNSYSLVRRDPNASSLPVPTVTLDDLCRAEGLDRLDYLKIDVEGAEDRVLAGARELVARYRPVIQVEVSIAVPELSQLGDYALFHAPGSHNRVCIPQEHARIGVPQRLGWRQVDH